MKLSSFNRLLIGFLIGINLISIFISGCASSPAAKEYVRKPLPERSPTLPLNTGAWKPIFGFAPAKDSSSVVSPLQWENGYAERLTVVWIPLPLQIRYLWISDDHSWLTSEFALFGTNYSRSRDYNWRPSLSFDWKKSLSSSMSYALGFLFQAEVKRGANESWARTLALTLGWQFQALSWLAIEPGLSVWNEVGEVRTFYLGEVPSSLSGPEAQNTHWRFPLSLALTARFSAVSELRVEARYYRLGYEESYTEVPIFLTLAYYF